MKSDKNKKKMPLAPRLPSDLKEIRSKGFITDRSSTRKFITDGNSLLLRELVQNGGLIKGIRKEKNLPLAPEVSIMQLWNHVAERKHVIAEFVGCGLKNGEKDRPLAVIRWKSDKYVLCDPYILAFAVLAAKADTLTVEDSKGAAAQPIAVCCGNTMVGMVMATRWSLGCLDRYNIDTEPIPLNKAFAGKTIR